VVVPVRRRRHPRPRHRTALRIREGRLIRASL